MGKIWEEVVVDYLRLKYLHSSGRSGEYHDKVQKR
jgi:hypothetical protein